MVQCGGWAAKVMQYEMNVRVYAAGNFVVSGCMDGDYGPIDGEEKEYLAYEETISTAGRTLAESSRKGRRRGVKDYRMGSRN